MGLQPMWSFPSAACLGPNPDTLEKKTKQRIMAERREKKRQRKIDYDSCHMQAINYYHLCVRITISSVTRPVFTSSFNLPAHPHAVSCNYCYA